MIDVDPSVLSNVIGSIYGAAYDPTRWAGAIGNLENLFHGSKACFGRFGPDLQQNDVVATQVDPVFQRRYFEEHIYQPNILADAITDAPVGTVYGDHAIVGGDKLRRTRFWNEWMAPQDMYGGIGSRVLESGPSYWYFDVQRGRGQEVFKVQDTELLQTIVPHLARAAEISRQIQSAQLLTSTFSHLPFGVIVIDGYMRIAMLNAAAETILLKPKSGLSRKSGHLVVAEASKMIALQRLIVRACSIHDDIIPGGGGDLLIRKEDGGRAVDIALSIGPLVNCLHELPFMERHAVIFICEISLDLPAGFTEQVRALFDLSPKEAGIAASLASGRTLKQAADDNRIQISTARSYLENIFHKTGARQQSRLVALLKSAQTIVRNTDR